MSTQKEQMRNIIKLVESVSMPDKAAMYKAKRLYDFGASIADFLNVAFGNDDLEFKVKSSNPTTWRNFGTGDVSRDASVRIICDIYNKDKWSEKADYMKEAWELLKSGANAGETGRMRGENRGIIRDYIQFGSFLVLNNDFSFDLYTKNKLKTGSLTKIEQ